MTTKPRLDRARPFGTVSPSRDGICFQQGGWDFDHRGEPLGLSAGMAHPAGTGCPAPPVRPRPVAALSRSAPQTSVPKGGIAWETSWPRLRRQVRALTGTGPKNKDEAKELLDAADLWDDLNPPW